MPRHQRYRRDDLQVAAVRFLNALDLTIYLDHSVIEIYANDRLTMTSRIYPDRDDAKGMQIAAIGGRVAMEMSVWSMGSIWI